MGRQTFTPETANASEYETALREFVALCRQTKGIFKRLNRF
jgi:hypothetical protein